MTGVGVIASALAIAVSATGSATAAPRVSEDAFPSPRALLLRGTHGYRVVVNAYPSTRKRGARVEVGAYRGTDLVRYTAPASLAGEGIRANLGRFGRIDLRWVPDGRVGEVVVSCHGHEPRWHLLFDRGAYVGNLRIRGGRGFTAVRAHRVEWQSSWYRGYSTCRHEGGAFTPGPGKILKAYIRGREGGAGLFAYQAKTGAQIEYAAVDREAVGKVEVDREVWVDGPSRTLTSTPDFSAATIDPPAPFTGTATFERTKGTHGTWVGDLAVGFPDGSVVPLAGDPFRATFYRGDFDGGGR
jgi:hypothetical protein